MPAPVVSDDSPYTTGGIGLLGTGPTEDLVEEIDTLVMLGTNFPYTKHLPQAGKVKVVQVEVDPIRAGVRLPTEVPLIGDVGATLEALLPLLRARDERPQLAKYFGVHVDKPGDLEPALREAFAHPGPALVDVAVDPNEPPMPGKVSYEQAKKFTQAFLHGQPHKAAIATTLFKDKIQQFRGE